MIAYPNAINYPITFLQLHNNQDGDNSSQEKDFRRFPVFCLATIEPTPSSFLQFLMLISLGIDSAMGARNREKKTTQSFSVVAKQYIGKQQFYFSRKIIDAHIVISIYNC